VRKCEKRCSWHVARGETARFSRPRLNDLVFFTWPIRCCSSSAHGQRHVHVIYPICEVKKTPGGGLDYQQRCGSFVRVTSGPQQAAYDGNNRQRLTRLPQRSLGHTPGHSEQGWGLALPRARWGGGKPIEQCGWRESSQLNRVRSEFAVGCARSSPSALRHRRIGGSESHDRVG